MPALQAQSLLDLAMNKPVLMATAHNADAHMDGVSFTLPIAGTDAADLDWAMKRRDAHRAGCCERGHAITAAGLP